jgi:hypothetical protein
VGNTLAFPLRACEVGGPGMQVSRHRVSCAGVAQLVEYELPKLGVAGSIPVARSIPEHRWSGGFLLAANARNWPGAP